MIRERAATVEEESGCNAMLLELQEEAGAHAEEKAKKLEEELTMSRRCITLRQVNIKESPPVCLLYLVEQRNQAGGMKCSHLKYNL